MLNRLQNKLMQIEAEAKEGANKNEHNKDDNALIELISMNVQKIGKQIL